MPHSEVKKTTENNFSFLSRIYNWFTSITQDAINWLFPSSMVYPDNAAGLLMRRALAKKSLIDLTSSGWVELPFWYKAFSVIGIMFAVGLIGILAGAPVFFALFALFLCIGTHVLLVSHEHHRRQVAGLMAEEAITLNNDLEANNELLDKAVKTVDEVAVQLEEHADHMEEQANALTEEAKVVHQHAEDITLIVEEVKGVTKDLVEQEEKLSEVLDESTAGLTRATKSLHEATQAVESISQTSMELSEAVQGLASSQIEYAEHVARFGIFVDGRMNAHQESEAVAEEFADKLMKKFDDADALLDEMIAAMEKDKVPLLTYCSLVH